MPVNTPEDNRQMNMMNIMLRDLERNSAKTTESVDEMEKTAKKTNKDIEEGTEERKKGFMKIFGSIQGVFKGIGTIMGELKGYFQKLFSTFTSHLREILGPVADAFDFVKEQLTNAWNTMKGVWTKLFISTGIQQKFMKGLFDIFRRSEKEKAREPGIKKTVLGFFRILGGIIGIMIGAILGILVKPIQLLLWPIKMIFAGLVLIVKGIIKLGKWTKKIISGTTIGTKFFGWVGDFFKSIGKTRLKFLKPLITGFGKVTKFFGWIGSLFGKLGRFGISIGKVLKKIPGITHLLAGVKFGLKWIGWPLTIFLGLISGFKAFFSTKGSIVERVIAGFTAMFDSIFELPIKILAWLPTKILSLFGIDFDVGNYIINFWHDVIGFVIETVTGWFTMDNLVWLKDKSKEIFDSITNLFDSIKNVFTRIISIFSGSNFKDWMLSIMSGGKFGKTIGEIWDDTSLSPSSGNIGSAVSNNIKAKQEIGAANSEEMVKELKENTKVNKQMYEAYKTKKEDPGKTAIVGGGGDMGGGQRPVPTDVENPMLAYHCMN